MPPPRQPIAALPPAEVEKICAGEVVERPLSVVKELIENALDAGATSISIDLEDGGRELIRVADDGCGMPFAELPLALRRHHTSKIRCLDDLYALSTLGFRGEALGSAAAVSRLTLTSRSAGEELGGRLECSGGALLSHRHTAFQPGTEVEVRELFFNTPARKKFLKSRQAEQSQITALISTYALAYPEVRWRLCASGREVLGTDGDGSALTVFAGLLGAEAAAGLVPLAFEFPPSAVHGFTGTPQQHSHNRARQWFFVNRRPVVNKLLYRAVDDAMREFLSAGKFPVGVFFLDVPPEELDVNVHPMKSEVNFAQPQAVYSLLLTAVRRALGQAAQERQRKLTRGLAAIVRPAGGGPPVELPPPEPEAPLLEPDAPPGHVAIPVYRMDAPFVPPGRATPPPPPGPREIEFPRPLGAAPVPEPEAAPQAGAPPGAGSAGAGAAAASAAQIDPTIETEAHSHILDQISLESAAPGARTGAGAVLAEALARGGAGTGQPALYAQVAGTYLVFAAPDAVYIIDQHAAHERLLFDRLYSRLERQARAARQQLLFPLVMVLMPGELALATECLPALAELGFTCTLGAGASLVVAEVPSALAGLVSAELLHDVLADLGAPGGSASFATRVKELAALIACKAAIKARQPLSPAETAALLAGLEAQPALSCPHGRPVAVRLGAGELERLFLR